MKADYKNWMPKGMLLGTVCGAVVSLILLLVFSLVPIFSSDTTKTVLCVVFLILTIVLVLVSVWMLLLYRAFSYNGKRQLSKKVIEGVASYVDLPDGGKGLDVGCGSGALTIACAKRNPKAMMIGMDRWGKEYASYNKALCENNARAEGVSNVAFEKGDAVKLAYADETFDAVTSNYVYHNIPSRDRQAILLETLRTLKKGGIFVLHDIMSKSKYGDMQAFTEKLKSMGYEEAELIDTTKGMFTSSFEARWMGFSGSMILKGRK